MTNFKNHPPYMELCLCRRCANAYFNDPTYWVERSTPIQTVVELCDVCSQYRGFDYLIWKKPTNVRLPKSHR